MLFARCTSCYGPIRSMPLQDQWWITVRRIIIQHTPVIPIVIIIGINVHNETTQFLKKSSLLRLRKVVRNHVCGWKILHLPFLPSNPVGNEEVLDVDVPGIPTTGTSAIFFQ
jgi:hypothetical protein